MRRPTLRVSSSPTVRRLERAERTQFRVILSTEIGEGTVSERSRPNGRHGERTAEQCPDGIGISSRQAHPQERTAEAKRDGHEPRAGSAKPNPSEREGGRERNEHRAGVGAREGGTSGSMGPASVAWVSAVRSVNSV